jgi:hypothetical protein
MGRMAAATLIFYLRPVRRKALAAARTEALCLLRDLNPTAPPSGPLAERGGLFWIALPAEALDPAAARLPRLGYTIAVDRLEDAARTPTRRNARAGRLRWRGRQYLLARLYTEDPASARAAAPDRRAFQLESAGGQVRAVTGYRGDGGPLSRRGLPVCDARLLVNLVTPLHGMTFLDPFAGAGGLILEAAASGYRALSCDRDPALRRGLSALGARHAVADARALPFAPGSVDALASEPPYDPRAEAAVLDALAEMARVLKPGGRLALLCAEWQAEGLRRQAAALGLSAFLDSPINRKGTACAVLAWERDDRRSLL